MDASTLAEIAADPDRLDHVPDDELPDVLAALRELEARVWLRLRQPSAPNGVSTAPEGDKLLKVDEAADILGVEPRWLYDRSDDLPFARKLAPRTLRFSERGLYRWLEPRP